MRELDKIDEKLSERPMAGHQWMLKVKWKSMRRASLEFRVPLISRQRRRLPSTGARTGRFVRGVVIVYEPGQCVRRTGNAQHWRLSSPGTGFPLYPLIIAS